MKTILLFVLGIMCISAHADTSFWYSYKDQIIGVGDLTDDKPCNGQSNGFVVHKGIIKNFKVSRNWVDIYVDLDKNYIETSGLTKRIFSISHDYLLKLDEDYYAQFFNLLKSKETMIFTGHICGATESSAIDLDNFFKFSSIVKK